MANVYDRVKVATSTTGTGNITLGGAHPGFRTFATAVGGNDTVYYVIEDGTSWEIGTALFTLATSILSSRTVIASTNANSPINLTGNAVVFSSLPKELIDLKAPLNTPNFVGPVLIDSNRAIDEKYLISRKTNLVTNGTAHMGSNHNFTGFAYSAADGFYSKGCFTAVGDGTSTSTIDLMPVNPLLRHKLSLAMKASPSVGATHTVTLGFYDADGLEILPLHVGFSTTTTTLAQSLDPDDTVIVLTNSSGWNASTGADTTQRGFIAWNYTNSGGTAYAAGTYSRNAYSNLWASDASVNTGTHTITLSSPWAGPTLAAGTTVSRSRGAAAFTPVAVNAVAVPNSWTSYSGFIEGVDTAGTFTAGMFPPGTAYTKVKFSLNNGTTGGGIRITQVDFDLAWEPGIAAGTTAQYWRGDKTWQTLNKAAVGLGSVDNTADTAKSVASAAVLTTSRNFSISGGGITAANVGFTGAANVTLSASVDAGHITLARMANLAANSILGNNTGSAATPLALTGTQITAMLDNFTSTLKGLVPLSGGGTTNFLRADGTWAAPGGGGSVSDTAYAGSWNGVTGTAPSQNAVYDKIETLASLAGATFTGGVVIDPSTGTAGLRLDANASQYGSVTYSRAGLDRWQVLLDNSTESGSNVGGDYLLARYADNGSWIATAFAVNRANGTFTNYGNMVVDPASGDARLSVDSIVGQQAVVSLSRANVLRWSVGHDGVTESGSNAGSDFFIARHADNGSWINNPITITRSTGTITLANHLSGTTMNTTGAVGVGASTAHARFHVRDDANSATTGMIIQNRAATLPSVALYFISGSQDLSDNRYACITSGGNTSPNLAFWVANGASPFVAGQFLPTGTLQLYTSTANAAALRIPHGAVPTTPTNGDIWTTTAGVYARINSSTVRVDNSAQAIVMHINGGGVAIASGQKFDLPSVPYDCTVVGWTITGDVSGSAVVDILRSTYANYPTMSSIAGTEKPTLSAAQKNQDLTLSSWTTGLTAGDVLRANVDSASTVKTLTITIWVTRT